jgi:hypothetical protein
MQSFKNHRRLNPAHHLVAAPLASAAAIWSLVGFIKAPSGNSALLAVMGLGLAATALVARQQAVMVQNRLIRLEMTLRFPRALPADLAARTAELSLRQVIALRFAPDAELPDLVRRTLAGEFASPTDIKRAIRNWQSDDLRA